MEQFSKNQIKYALKEINARPLKSFGQNFLINQKILAEIPATADITNKDTILEIGAGVGNLTFYLAKAAKKVIAFEIDRKLFKVLQKNTKNFKNVEIREQDIKKANFDKIFGAKPYKVVANIPYYLTSFLLKKMFLAKNKPKTVLFLIQKEVARRIIASPPEMSVLALSVQLYSDVKIIKKVKKGNFWPIPKVDSALVLLKTKSDEEIEKSNPEFLLKLAKIGFRSRRKQLKNNLKKWLKLGEKEVLGLFKKASLKEKVRAEELSLEKWRNLACLLLKKTKNLYPS